MRSERNHGFSLIEVLIAILVLSTGMLALAALQSGITRSGVSAKARSQAVAAATDVLDLIREEATRDEAGFRNLDSRTLTVWSPPDVSAAGAEATRFERVVRVTRFVPGKDAAECAGAPPPCLRAVAVSSAAAPSPAEVKRVDVEIRWDDDSGVPQTVQVSDLIAFAPRPAQDGLMQPLLHASETRSGNSARN